MVGALTRNHLMEQDVEALTLHVAHASVDCQDAGPLTVAVTYTLTAFAITKYELEGCIQEWGLLVSRR